MEKMSQGTKLSGLLLIAVLAITLVGCGGDDKPKGKTAYTGAPGASVEVTITDADGAVPLSTKKSKVGEVIAGQEERTLYTFRTDSGKTLDCRGECAWKWLPVIVGRGVSISGAIEREKVGAVEYAKDSNQLTYGGHPLYYFSDDQGEDSVLGNDKESFGATWSAVTPTGELASK